MVFKKRLTITLALVAVLIIVLGIAIYLIISDIDNSKNDISFLITDNLTKSHTVDIEISFDAHKKSSKYYKVVTGFEEIYMNSGFTGIKEKSLTITGIDYNCYVVGKIVTKKREIYLITYSVNSLVDYGFTGIWTQDNFKISDLNANYQLKCNIDLKDSGFSPIGSETQPYTGVFNGNGYTIKNFKADGELKEHFGLFRYNKGTIKNLKFEDAEIINAGPNSGGLVGINEGLVENCSISGSVTGIYGIGGIVGENRENGILRYLINKAKVKSDNPGGDSWCAGGILGTNSKGLVEYCKNEEEVYAVTGVAGGIVARNDFGIIKLCYNTGKIGVAAWDAGGIAGWNYGGLINYCYNYGEVCSLYYCGGIAGSLGREDSGGLIEFCYNAVKTTGDAIVGFIFGQNPDSPAIIRDCIFLDVNTFNNYEQSEYQINKVISKNAEEMKLRETYENFIDFDMIFFISQTDYPFPQFIKFSHNY